MNHLGDVYKTSLALLTDLYQLTMACGYFKSGLAELEGAFHLHFRKNPFAGGYTVACGLPSALEYLQGLRFLPEDLEYLAGLRASAGTPLFDAPFLSYLEGVRLQVDVDAVPEGTVVFPYEPILRVTGRLIEGQLLETALLNLVNFQSLIATKASRVALAARGAPVVDFGLRRAQGVDGALSASRAAYVGGCAATSNVLAGRLFGIPVRGTHAHSWVMSFDDELESFRAYARAMPEDCVFLVDTYDTLEGVRRAIEAAQELKRLGRRLAGVRLDSGDLAYLSQEARRLLDEAGLHDAKIVASNDLDEHLIESLQQQEAQVAVWGVGTKLVTGYDQPALGGVYKLAAVRRPGGKWSPRVKISEQAEKTSHPGLLQVRRFRDESGFVCDMVYDEEHPPQGDAVMVDPLDPTRRRLLSAGAAREELLIPVLRGGRAVYSAPPLAEARARASAQLAALHRGIKRLANPHRYPVGLEKGLHERKTELILKTRGLERTI